MQIEKWNRARDLFAKILDLPRAERDPYLASACDGDATLLAHVRDLIAAYDGDSFLEHPPPHVATAAGAVAAKSAAEAETLLDTAAPPYPHRTGDGERPAAPAAIGPYDVLGPIGEGGMGVVYRASHRETGRLVALKTVRVPSESLLAGIRREIHALARLDHPGIVRVLDEGVDAGLPWYAMEIVEGVSLRDFAAPAAPDVPPPDGPPPDVLTLARRLCDTLAFLHGEGIVHRDLKPENVLVRPSGQPVLVDFGIASVFASSEGREVLDAIAAAGGTLAYMAPEQIRGDAVAGDPVDARADLYALGCILYELVAGRPPFLAKKAEGFARAHLHARPPPPSRFAPGVPEALDALVLRLLAKRPTERIGYAADVAAALAGLGAEVGPGGPRPRAYLYRPAFAGREATIAGLDRRLDRLMRGEGGVVLVGGESGVGKTRLAVEVARRAERAGARVLAGECLPPGAEAGGAGAALHALRAPLRRVADRCRELGETEADALVGPRGRLLARYEPALAGLPGQEKFPEPAELPPEAARLRLFESLAATLGELARSRPLLLLLDDLQWADELTLGLVDFLARADHEARGPVLLLGTYRSEEQPEALRGLLATSAAAGVELGRLEQGAVERMVGGMLALEPAPSVFSRYLARESEGNPFFVAEYLRAAVEEGLLWRDDGSWQVAGEGAGGATEADYERLGLPRSLRALVERRLGGLGREAARALSASAVAGREADAALLERMAGLDGEALLEALERLRQRQILEEGAGGRLRFTHDKLREAAYDAIAPDDRARLHGAAALALEAGTEAREHPALLADHWRAAGEPERARPYYLTAAGQASARYAHAEAERRYRAYLDLADAVSAERVQARIDLFSGVLKLQGRLDEGLEVASAALEDALALGRRDLEATVRGAVGTLLREASRFDEAREAFEAAIATAREEGDRLTEASAIDGLGAVAIHQRRFAEGEERFRASARIFAEIGVHRGEAISVGNLALVLLERGLREEVLDLARRALAIHRAGGHRSDEGVDLTNLGHLLRRLGRIEEALAASDEALVVHRETGYRQFEGLTLSNLADQYLEAGRPEAAEARCREAIAALEAAGERHYLCTALSNHGIICRLLGDYERAEASTRRALELGARHRTPDEVLLYTCDLGHTELAGGRPARERLEAIESEAAALGASPGGELAETIARLRRAVEAFERGEPLVRGEHPSDAPAWARERAAGPPDEGDADG